MNMYTNSESDALNQKLSEAIPVDGDTTVPKSDLRNRDLSWKDSLKQSLASVISLSLVIQAGINMAYSAVLLPQLSGEDSDMKITMSEASWIASIVTISLPPGALAVGPLMDKFGRKRICIFTAIPFLISWVIQSRSKKVWHMYLARILAGIAGGLSTVSTVYVAEITHPNFRPMLLSLNSVFVSLGILITCVFGSFLDWRTMAMIYFAIAAFSFFALFLIPESPHWSMTFRNDQSAVVKSLKWIYPRQQVFLKQHEIFMESRHKLQANLTEEPVKNEHNLKFYLNKSKLYIYSYREPVIYKPLIILLLLFAFQQLSGAYAIIFYAVDLFRKIDGEFQKSINAFVALVLLGAIRFVMSIVSAVLAKKIGRRTLLMTSAVGMSFTSLIVGLYMSLMAKKEITTDVRSIQDHLTDNMALICVLGYVCFSAIGFLMIPWTLIGELLPMKVRGVMSGVLVAVAYVLMFGTVKVFPYLLEWLKVQTIFFGMSLTNITAVCFIFFFLPETFGRTFAEIETYFTKR